MGEAGRWGASKGWLEGGGIGAYHSGDGAAGRVRCGARLRRSRVRRRGRGLRCFNAGGRVLCWTASRSCSQRSWWPLTRRPPPPHGLHLHFWLRTRGDTALLAAPPFIGTLVCLSNAFSSRWVNGGNPGAGIRSFGLGQRGPEGKKWSLEGSS